MPVINNRRSPVAGKLRASFFFLSFHFAIPPLPCKMAPDASLLTRQLVNLIRGNPQGTGTWANVSGAAEPHHSIVGFGQLGDIFEVLRGHAWICNFPSRESPFIRGGCGNRVAIGFA